jgi:hypothetical protein
VWNRTGSTLAEGDIVMFDHTASDGHTGTTLVLGADAGTLSNVIVPATAGLGAVSGDGGYWFGAVLPPKLGTTNADDTLVWIRVMGICKVKVTADAALIGAPVYPQDALMTLISTQTDGVRPIARLREANASAAGAFEAIFDGIHGVGAAQSAS